MVYLLSHAPSTSLNSTIVGDQNRDVAEWRGHLPCICPAHSGCDQHNPEQNPVYCNTDLPPKYGIKTSPKDTISTSPKATNTSPKDRTRPSPKATNTSPKDTAKTSPKETSTSSKDTTDLPTDTTNTSPEKTSTSSKDVTNNPPKDTTETSPKDTADTLSMYCNADPPPKYEIEASPNHTVDILPKDTTNTPPKVVSSISPKDTTNTSTKQVTSTSPKDAANAPPKRANIFVRAFRRLMPCRRTPYRCEACCKASKPPTRTEEAIFEASEPPKEAKEAATPKAFEPLMEKETTMSKESEPPIEAKAASTSTASEPPMETEQTSASKASEPPVEAEEATTSKASAPPMETEEATTSKASEPPVETEEVAIQQSHLPLQPLQNDGKPQFWTKLPFDSGSFTPLVPLHSTMPYHLAFYHLECARRRLNLKSAGVKAAFVPELSCRGTSSFSEDVLEKQLPYNWSSEVYFEKGEFLQKQELECTADTRRRDWPTISVSVCRHKSMGFQKIRIDRDAGGLAIASLDVTFQPRDELYNPPYSWSSTDGINIADFSLCGRCYSDLEFNAELIDDQLRVRFTCYRVLGAATERFLPAWAALLEPPARRHPLIRNPGHYHGGWRVDSPDTYQVYRRVWKAAMSLDRPGLHFITYATNDGTTFSGAT